MAHLLISIRTKAFPLRELHKHVQLGQRPELLRSQPLFFFRYRSTDKRQTRRGKKQGSPAQDQHMVPEILITCSTDRIPPMHLLHYWHLLLTRHFLHPPTHLSCLLDSGKLCFESRTPYLWFTHLTSNPSIPVTS
ncbi:uncharacterized protein ACNLHF_014970 isoform 1-T1 [Anomaloglossus baeobatrachus]